MYKIKKSNKVKRILVFIAILLTIGSVVLINSYKKGTIMQSLVDNPKASETLQADGNTDIDISQDTNISSKYIDKSEYTDEYMDYMNLSDEEKQNVAVIPNKYKVSKELFNDKYFQSLYNKNNYSNYAEAANSFDLRSITGALNVEDQGSTNLCWAYAANKILEISSKRLDSKTYDFSETYLDYIISNNVYGYRREIGAGGLTEDAFEIMSAKGATTESRIPNGSVYSGNYTEIKNAECVRRVIQYVTFPHVTKDDSNSEKENAKNYAKAHIQNYGGVAVRVNSPDVSYGYNPSKYAFCSSVDDCNLRAHEVTIIGWDDNFSKDNFTASGSNKPTQNGAWLVVNSWGTDWGNGGYYWISYEDPHVYEQMTGIVSSSEMHPYVSGFKTNLYYPNASYTLKPGNIVSNGEGTYKVEFERKSKDKEILDYIVVICNGEASAYIANDSNNDSSYVQVGQSQESNFWGDSSKLVFNPNNTVVIDGDKFSIKIEYTSWFGAETMGYGLCKADNIGGATYKKSGDNWNKTDYNIQVVAYTHSYDIKSIEIVEQPKTNYYKGQELDLSTGKVKVTYADNTSKTVPLSECVVSGYDANTEGTQSVSVTYGSKKVSTNYSIEVEPVQLEKIEVKTKPTKLSYYVGDSIDLEGLVLKCTNNDGTTFNVTEGYTCTQTELLTAGKQTITVSYGGKNTTFEVSVANVELESISVKTKPSKLSYYIGDTLDLTGLEVIGINNNGSTFDINQADYICTPTQFTASGEQNITITYNGKTTTFKVSVADIVVKEIEIKNMPSKLSYYVGDKLDLTGLVLIGTNNNGSKVEISGGFTANIEEITKAGEQTVTIAYGDATTTYTINAQELTVEKIEIKEEPTKTEYVKGENLNLSGLKLLITYNSGKTKEVTTGYSANIEELNNVGEEQVIITYEGKQASFTVNVKEEPKGEDKPNDDNKKDEDKPNSDNKEDVNKPDNNVDKNNSQEDNGKDDTIADGKIPQTGNNKVVIYSIFVVCLVSGIIFFIKYKRLKDIK